jgi:hypothetical protein
MFEVILFIIVYCYNGFMSYCIKCYQPAEVCFCERKKVPLSEYAHEMRECTDLKCYCKEHLPKNEK